MNQKTGIKTEVNRSALIGLPISIKLTRLRDAGLGRVALILGD